MNLELDKKGYPVLKLAVAVPTESGNPYHDPFSGQFATSPPGVKVIVGKALLKDLKGPAKKLLFDASKKTKANQMTATLRNGVIEFTLYRDGRMLHRFSVSDDSQEGGKPGEGKPTTSGGLKAPTGAFRDAIVDAARETSLEGDALRNYFEEKLGEKIDDTTLAHMAELVDEQRVHDLSDYLNSYLSGDKQTNKVRLSAPRGFVRKVFASLEDDVVHQVFERLKLRGWSDDVIRDRIISGFSKERRERLLPGKKKSATDDDKQTTEKKLKKRRG